jgi:leucyl aminopeptidase
MCITDIFCSLQLLLQVNNTDAEGRLTLADALVYACNQGVEKVILKIMCHGNASVFDNS